VLRHQRLAIAMFQPGAISSGYAVLSGADKRRIVRLSTYAEPASQRAELVLTP
jgi:hypothetical protein